MKSKVDLLYSRMTEVVKYIYCVHIILAFCTLTTETVITHITPILVVAISAGILLYRLIYLKSFSTYPYIWLYVAFVMLYILTSILNISYGVVGNIKIVMWMTILMGVLYLSDVDKTKQKVRNELKNCLLIVISLTTIMNIVGIGMLVANFCTYRQVTEDLNLMIGLSYWGRLIGVYTDANYGAVQTVVAILGAVLLYLKEEKKFKKRLLIAVTIINMFHLAFSGSRTGLVALIVGAALFMFIRNIQTHGKIIKSGIFALVTAVAVFTINTAMISGYNQTRAFIAEVFSDNEEDDGDVENEFIEVGREEELSQDISNRRFDLWINAFEISMTKPLLGVSFANIVPYCRAELPDSYLLTNGFAIFDAFHNMFMDLLASQGWIGVILFLGIIVVSLRYLFINKGNIAQEDMLDCCFLFSTVAAILCSSLFVSQILYAHTPGTVLFWLLWGYLVYYFAISKKERHK